MTDWQKYNQLKAAVKEMRAAQLAYYTQGRTTELLKVAKAKEAKVDRLISDEHKNQLTLWR
ncbi:hypothetical protein [uncultured Pontibacter sp.]|uniref:hypothetical protein n=1 Tax=uncultured Pontibacter sp. TaxID=453356 RepID=UPI00261D5A61|nr:hypothetical protein [uncultured Pontibacter sp.]